MVKILWLAAVTNNACCWWLEEPVAHVNMMVVYPIAGFYVKLVRAPAALAVQVLHG